MLVALCSCGQSNSMIMVGLALTGQEQSTGAGESVQASLEESGHAVELAYAQSAEEQSQQINDLVKDGAAVLVVHPVDSLALEKLLSSGQSDVSSVTIIACGAPVCAECVKAYVGPDLYDAGRQQAEQVVKELGLAESSGEKFTVELVAGNGGTRALEGAMEVLSPYVESGSVVISGGSDAESCCTQDAAGRIQTLCRSSYSNQELNAVLCLGEGQAEQVVEALKGCYGGTSWPVVTGYGCDERSVQYLSAHMLSMVTYPESLDCAQLTEKAVSIASASEGEVQDELTPCTAVTRSDYKERLVDTGLYTKNEDGSFTKNEA